MSSLYYKGQKMEGKLEPEIVYCSYDYYIQNHHLMNDDRIYVMSDMTEPATKEMTITKCPHCGAPLDLHKVNWELEVIKCDYCENLVRIN